MNYFYDLPDDIKDKIYFEGHKIKMNDVMCDVTNNEYELFYIPLDSYTPYHVIENRISCLNCCWIPSWKYINWIKQSYLEELG